MKGKIYIPCLMWKQGEYQALTKFPVGEKQKIVPLIDVAPFFADMPVVSFDFDDNKPPKTIDDHLLKVAKRVKDKWGTNSCWVDLHHIDPTCRMKNGQHPVAYIFDGLRTQNVDAVPSLGLDQDSAYRKAVRDVVSIDHRGLCLRVNLERVAQNNFQSTLEGLLSEFALPPRECDFILDLRAPEKFQPLEVLVGIVKSSIRNLPNWDNWRSVGLLAHSLPISLKGFPSGVTILPRGEWQLYKSLREQLDKSGVRSPIFGDYVINSPKSLKLDMRVIKPRAAIRYSINDDWLISVGEQIRGKNGVGLGQFSQLCELIVKSGHFSGQAFSFGDEYIFQCAKKIVKPGNLTRFRQVGTSHHLTFVLSDLANLGVS